MNLVSWLAAAFGAAWLWVLWTLLAPRMGPRPRDAEEGD